MRSGTAIGIGMAAIAAVAGVTIFILQGFVYYHRVDGVTSIAIGGEDFAVSDYEGLDNDTLPLRLRGCFNLEDPQAALTAGAPAPDAEAFNAPFWFGCWDAEKLSEDLASGAAVARIAEIDQRGDFTFERIVAVYPDGRAYQWRRLVKDD